MAMELRYKGAFLAVDGTAWECHILQEADAPFQTVGWLVFEADEPLVLEWKETAKHEVMCGSSATLQIESPGDRTYQDLYTVKPGTIRLDVYRSGALYWSGMLDPEFYEEPYQQAARYTVQLTFSDFGILERKKYRLTGMKSLADILAHCISEAGLNVGETDCSGISTQTEDGEPLTLQSLEVRSDNFVDEDGEQATLQEVLEGVMQPLALRMVQKAGKIYVYDLNGLYMQMPRREAVWDGDSSTMGVDAVYNNAKVTWSTYAQAGNMLPAEVWTQPVNADAMALNSLDGATNGKCRLWSFHYSTDLEDWPDATDAGFTLWTCSEGMGATLDDPRVTFFKTVPQYDGTEEEGIALSFASVRGYRVSSGSSSHSQMQSKRNLIPIAQLAGTPYDTGTPLYTVAGAWIPNTVGADRLALRLTLEMLLDVRANPYEGAANLMSGFEQKDWQDNMNRRANYMYVPVVLKFTCEKDGKIYVWDNREVVLLDPKYPIYTLSRGNYGKWVEYAEDSQGNPQAWGYLAWYDPQDRVNRSGVANGWRNNRHAINPHKQDIISKLANAADGQYIPYPQVGQGGTLSITILGRGWMMANEGDVINKEEVNNPGGMFGERISWVMHKLPQLEIVNDTQFGTEIDTDDVEYSADINPEAKESIELETICGSKEGGVTTARGAYFEAGTGVQVTQLRRGGRTTQLENLLIGTIYSQHADRRVKLSGDIRIDTGGVAALTEQNQPNKLFMLVATIQDTRMAVEEAVMVELRPDEYKEENETAEP